MSLERTLRERLDETGERLPVGRGDVGAMRRRGDRRLRSRRWFLATGGALALAGVVSVGVSALPQGPETGVAWAGGHPAFTRVHDVALPGETAAIGSMARVGDHVYVSTETTSYGPVDTGETDRVYAVDLTGGTVRRLGTARGVAAVLAGRGGAVWAVTAAGVQRVDPGHARLSPPRRDRWSQAISAVSYRGDLYLLAYVDGGLNLVRLDGASGQVVSARPVPRGFPDFGRLVLTSRGPWVVCDDHGIQAAALRRDGTFGPWRFVTRPRDWGVELTTTDGRHVYTVAGSGDRNNAVRRYDLAAGPGQRPSDGPVLVRSRGFETAQLEWVLADRGRVFASVNNCDGPMCLFELDARTLQQIDGPQLLPADPGYGSHVLALHGDTLWIGTAGTPGHRNTHVVGLRVHDLS